MTEKLVILPKEASELILSKVKAEMAAVGIECALVTSNANLYYLTGRVFCGYIFISLTDEPVYFVRRPAHLTDERAASIRKPEDIAGLLAGLGIELKGKLGLELSRLPYTTVGRLTKALGHTDIADVTPALSTARSAKTPYEIQKLRESAVKHSSIYPDIPSLYEEGMTDVELQISIERLLRLRGCLGQFRISGEDMELYMGNILAGDNADAPSPYDFAMGGAGVDPSLPVGANGTIIHPGMTVMADVNGNFDGYMTDITRCYSLGEISSQATDAHRLSIEICRRLQQEGVAGKPAKELYETAHAMAEDAGLGEYFMGHRQHAGFVGHGVGIEINELPVIAPRSRNILGVGNVIALEPKFVIPGTGAVGIENTYLVRDDGPMECLTPGNEEIMPLA